MNWTVGDVASRCSNDNRSGLKPLLHVTTEPEVGTIPADTNLLITADITMSLDSGQTPAVPGTFKTWELSKVLSKNTFVTEDIGDEDSAIRQTTVVVTVPKLTADRLYALRGGCSYVIIVPDYNGALRIVGEKGNGCTMMHKHDINDSSNQAEITFKWNSGHDPYFYEGTIPA